MKKSVLNFMKYGFGLLIVALAVAHLFGAVFDVSWLIGGGAMAMAAGASEVIQETVTTENKEEASPDILLNTIDKKISLIRPDLNPLDTIVRQMGIVTRVKSWEVEYYAVETRGVADALSADVAAPGSADQPEWTLLELPVTNIHIWTVDDTGILQGTQGSDGKEIVFNVVSIDKTNHKLQVFLLNGTGAHYADWPAMTTGDKITRIGNGKSELDAQTDSYAVMPQPDSNFCQIHMAQVEEGLYAKLHDAKVEWNINDFRSEALYDLRRRMELTSIIGYKRKGYDTIGGDYKYFSDGVVRKIDKNLTYDSSTIGDDRFAGWAKDIFTGNNGSSTRVLFAGSDLMKYLSGVPTVDKQLTAENVMVKWGVTFNQIVTNFGTLLVKHHAALADIGYSEKGIVLDMNNIEKKVLKPLETRTIDLIGSGQKLANADNISEAFCLLVKNPDTHAIISKV